MLFQKRCCQPRKLGNIRELNQGREKNLLEIQEPAWSSNPDASPSLIWVEKERIARLESWFSGIIWGFSSMVAEKKFLSPVRLFPAGFSVEWCFGPAQLSGQADGSLKMGVFKESHSQRLASFTPWNGFPGFLGSSGLPRGTTSFIVSSKFLGKWMKQLRPAGEQRSQRHLQQVLFLLEC